MKWKTITNKMKRVSVKDCLQAFPMVVGFICSLVFRFIRPNIWLICERKNEARDNGYCFFKYLAENGKPGIFPVYAINRRCVDYQKVKEYRCIQFGSLTHWIYYFSAKRNISTQKNGNPNAALCYFLEVVMKFNNHTVFLQHGITKDDAKWLYYEQTNFDLFVCAAKPEYEYIKERFGYPEGNLALVGFCRYDMLMKQHAQKRQIPVMPTHRQWLSDVSEETLAYEQSKDFRDSEYFQSYYSMLNSGRLLSFLEENDLSLVFYLHSNLQRHSNLFQSPSSRIVIASDSKYDVQQLLQESSLLVTDYSSVYFDFAYMRKPVIYYQFDLEKYRRGQYAEGYFSYEKDGFGPIAYHEDELIDNIVKLGNNQFQMTDTYAKRVTDFFSFSDAGNCERTFRAIKNMRR